MSSRKQDLLGLLIDTSLEQADDDPMFDGQGRTGLLVPRRADISDDTEDDDAFASLREDLSPGEASEEVETMRPLSAAERKILSETPGLDKLTRVDDAEQEDFIIAHSRKGYQGMDDILDDAVYGWGIPGLSSVRRLGRGAYRGVRRSITAPANLAYRGVAMPAGMAYRGARGAVPGLGRPAPQSAPQDDSDPYAQDPGAQPYPPDPGAADASDPYTDPYASQGESDMNHNEEEMERLGLDSDAGWGIPGLSSLKKIAKGAYKYGKKGVTAPAGLAYRGVKKLGSGMMHFIPGRDANKAKLVRALHKKLTVEHANWLAIQDQKAGLPPQSPAKYATVAKLWATQKIKQGGLPTNYVMGRDEILGSEIMGGDIMGSWWNPISWFAEKSTVIVNQTQGERSAVGPDGQPLPVGPDGQPLPLGPDGQPVNPDGSPYTADPYAQANPYAAADPYAADPYAADPYAADPYASQGEDMTTGISGEDSLGAFATEILSGVASPAQKTAATKADQLVNLGVIKLRSGKPLTPGEVGIIAKLAQEGHPRAKRVYGVLMKEGIAVSAGDDSGAWLHMLNPAYWLKSSEEKKLTDIEKQKWIENADLQKQLKKKEATLAQAERAKAASEAVAQAKAQAASTEAQLKSIEASITGELIRDLNADVNGVFVGHEKPTAVAQVVMDALFKIGKKQVAIDLYEKIAKSQPLTRPEIKEARQIAKLLSQVRVVHGDLMTEADDPALVMHGAFVGACVLGNIQAARSHNARCQKAAEVLSGRLASGEPLTTVEKKATVALLNDTRKLRNFTKSHVTGGAFVGLDRVSDPNSTKLRTTSFVAAAKVMSEADKKMLSAIVKLAKAGNPRAVKGLAQLKQTGEIMGGDFVGSFLSDTFKAVTMPITVPAKYLYKGAKWTGQKLGIVSKGGPASPEQVRLAKLRAARQRALASQARARAADAQTEAELRAQQAIADSADAEADAADAEALSKEAAMRTAEIEANPDMANTEDSSGVFVGSWNQFVGYDPKVKDPFESKNPKAKKEKAIVKKAAEKSATGMKIRSGAALYAKAHKGDKKAQTAIRTMVAKAKKGDQQAILDTRAVQAGREAVLAREKAKKREVVALTRIARKKKVVAFQKKLEAAAANKLARSERRHDLKKLAIVERKAAAGNPKARAFIAKQVVAAKKGDKKAQTRVRGMQLVKSVRVAAPNKRERRNLVAAQKLAERARRGDPKAVRQVRVLQASAKAGNPNAKRAIERLALGAAVATTVATGVVVLASDKKKKGMSRADHKKNVESVISKKQAGTASREELASGARSAQALGDKKTAGELAVTATNTPSATEQLKKTATVVAAKEAGNEEAKKAIVNSLDEAKTGDPAAIKKTANVVAVQTIDDVNKGQAISPTMRDAINLNERIKAGDPTAVAEAKRITAAATSENPAPEATMAAVGLGAAVALDKALASKPKAKAELMEKVNPAMAAADQSTAEAKVGELVAKANAGTITPEEGVQGVRLAEKLNKPKLAAEIAAKAPPFTDDTPLSSLPDMPLAPITSAWELFKESLKAVTFSTRDPLANYRGGIAARAKEPSHDEPVSSSGWSPFAYFRSAAPWIAPLASSAAAAASFTNLLANKQRKSAPTPTPTPAPAQGSATQPAAPVATVQAVAPAPAAAPAEAPTTTAEGATIDFSQKSSTQLPNTAKQELREAADALLVEAQSLDPSYPREGSATEKKALNGDKKAIEIMSINGAIQLVEGTAKGAKLTDFSFTDSLPLNDYTQAVAGKASARSRMKEMLNLAGKGGNLDALKYTINVKALQHLASVMTNRPSARQATNQLLFSARQTTSAGSETPEEIKNRVRREIAEEGVLPPTPATSRGKKGGDSSVLGEDKSFKNYVKEAIKAKKMSKTDFNKALEAHLGTKASKESKLASGEKVLKFLAGKGVKVEQ